MTSRAFFEEITGNSPFPWQEQLSEGDWPDLLDVPTGLGKTAGGVVAWLSRRLAGDPSTGRRLVYCLPMRSLVRQVTASCEEWASRARPFFEDKGRPAPTVHVLMGGEAADDWELSPESEAILVGTQDMLLSRALCRGFGMNRYRWPVPFALLSSDCFWVLDETQLMGVGVETSAQLQALRQLFGTFGPARTLWMSATLDRGRFNTVARAALQEGTQTLTVSAKDREIPVVAERLGARKRLEREADLRLEDDDNAYATGIAARAAELHEERGGLTLVLLNRVSRAQAVFAALDGEGIAQNNRALVHSRFRAADRAISEELLFADGDRIVVATQALEAGIDVSARTMITELSPFASLVQRFGRLNRYGEHDDALAVWIDAETEKKKGEQLALPYLAAELAEARLLLEDLEDVGPARLREVRYEPAHAARPVLRRKDLVDLFDTTPDLLGFDIDVSRYVRDEEDTDVLFYWRELGGEPPSSDEPAAQRQEVCRVSTGNARAFFQALTRKRRQRKGKAEEAALHGYRWDPLEGRFEIPDTLRPGDTLLLPGAAGGYDPATGFTGKIGVPVPAVPSSGRATNESMDADPGTGINRWIRLEDHLRHAAEEAESLVGSLGIDEEVAQAVVTAAKWHDVGKAHEEFQRRLLEPVEDEPDRPPGDGLWAKSDHRLRAKTVRPGFRHELASALAWLQSQDGKDPRSRDLVAYLIAAHHGKVRLSIRSLPGENLPEPDADRSFARGIWDGDLLPAVDLSGDTRVGPFVLDLSPVAMGEGSWLERTLGLRDDATLGPFRLAFLETLVRVADWRASQREGTHGDP